MPLRNAIPSAAIQLKVVKGKQVSESSGPGISKIVFID